MTAYTAYKDTLLLMQPGALFMSHDPEIGTVFGVIVRSPSGSRNARIMIVYADTRFPWFHVPGTTREVHVNAVIRGDWVAV